MDVFTSASRSHRRATAAFAVAAVAVAVLALLATLLFHGAAAAPSPAVPTAFAHVQRTNVVEREQAAGTLGFSGSYTVFSGTTGVITWLPAAGITIRRGEELYEIDRRPVALFYGGRPAYRAFAFGMTDGGDVYELKQNLLALGFTNGGRVTLDDHFDLAARGAVKEWQRALGIDPTGTIPLGSVVFLPGAIRIAAAANGIAIGATVPSGAPLLSATTTRRAVLAPLDPGIVAQLRVGDRVVVTMPDNTAVAGRVASIGRVATASNSDSQNGSQGPATPTIPVTVELLGSRSHAGLDQAPVQLSITSQEVRHVLAVPISALLAEPGGSYAVEVAAGASTRLVGVTTGLFDDVAGRVEVDAPNLRAGMRVVVPSG